MPSFQLQTDYSTLSYAVGGWFWRFCSQFGIVILLLGTLAGGVAQIGEAFSYGLLKVSSPLGLQSSVQWRRQGKTGHISGKAPIGVASKLAWQPPVVRPPPSYGMRLHRGDSQDHWAQVCNPPGWLVNGSGRMLMVICVLVIVVPLCFPDNLTSVRALCLIV